MTKLILTSLFSVIGLIGFSQILVSDADFSQPGNPLPCALYLDNSTPNFYDTGNNSANYGDNENETITFCPDNGGSKVALFFGINAGFLWDVDGSDTLYVYDGPTAASPLLVAANSITNPFGMSALETTATWANPSGCVTVQFVSDALTTGTGWDANVSCSSPWQPMELHIGGYIAIGEALGQGDNIDDMTNQMITGPLADTGYLNICLGDSVLLVNETVYPFEPATGGNAPTGGQPLYGGGYNQSALANHLTEWEFSDGTVQTGDSIWFTPGARTGYFISMTVTDNATQFAQMAAKIRVSTIPSFATCSALEDTICLGEATQLVGGITPGDTAGVDPVNAAFQINGSFGAQTFLPDGSGQNYTTDINISGFPAGLTLQNSGDLEQVCVSMEHSYLGDLEMMLTCPGGTQSVMIFNSYTGTGLYPGGFGGGGTYVGGADDASSSVGECEEYCFSENAGSLPAWVNGYNTIAASGPSVGVMVEPGTYIPEESFLTELAGCPLNGTWTLTVRDNLGIDDGWICEWGIFFEASLNPNSETYAPSITSEQWLSDPTILTGDNDTAIIVLPNAPGTNSYTFEVVDNFGCTYDTSINVVTQAGPSIIPGGETCDDFFQFNSTYAPSSNGGSGDGGGTWSYTGPGNAAITPNSTFVNATFTPDQNGVYLFTFIDNRCGDTLTEEVTFLEDPIASVFGDIAVCEGDTAFFYTDTQVGTSIAWTSPNGTLISVDPTAWGTEDGLYTMSLTNICSTDTVGINLEVEICSVPNVITPNGDNSNDYFYTKYADTYDDVNLIIYNRWGRVVYKTESYDNTWNGKDMGDKQLSDGVYFFVMTWNEAVGDEAGTITIIDSK
jgi:gliding motility-associated-like protein